MKRLTFYKPNSKNTGAAFSANFKGQELYINITKQFSWNDSNRRASFKENVKNPQKYLSVKMNTIEAANIIYAIQNKVKYTTYHQSKNQKLSIFFESYFDKTTNSEKGFAFKVLKEDSSNSVDKISFSVGFSFPELVILRSFFEEFIKESFSITSSEAEPSNEIEDSRSSREEIALPTQVKPPEKVADTDDDW